MIFSDRFSDRIEKTVERDLWSYLVSSSKKILMYGMGNGADKILAVCEKYGVEVTDFFASDGFVRGHSFHGKRVLSFSEAKEKYGAENMIVLLSFGSCLPDVLELFRQVAAECELYAPDVPVCADALFNYEFFLENRGAIDEVYSLLTDGESRRIYENIILYKLTGRIDYLFAAESDKDATYALMSAERFRSAADLGAYNGDTVREMLSYCPEIERIHALEPDRRNFRKLSSFCEGYGGYAKLTAINAAAWSEDCVLSFGGEGNRNSGIFAPQKTAKSVEVDARSIDGLLGGEGVDYIKYDVEGAEREAIEGSRGVILSHRPTLLISAYHKSEDIFALPLQIHALRPDYALYYRRYPYVPAWDINLICI